MQNTLAIILISLVLFLLIALGFWQLDRAEQKQQILDKIVAANNSKVKEIFDIQDLANKEYHNILLTGNYIDKNFIYDNQTFDGLYGYYVITPFIIKGTNEVVLVNRGFKLWGETRIVPTLITNTKTMTVQTKVNKIVNRATLMDKTISNKFPLIVQNIDIEFIREILKLNVANYILLLDKSEPNGYVREWKPFYGSKDKHIAYAIQWFAMAIVLCIIILKIVIKNKKLNKK